MSKDAEATSTLHIPTTLWERMQAAADKDGRSGRNWAINRLEAILEEEESKE